MIEWFQNPTFPLPYVVGVIFVFYLTVRIAHGIEGAKMDKERTLWENEQRSRLTYEDYKTDKWQGSFNHYPKKQDAEGNICEWETKPKPPDAVKPWWKRFKENF